MHTWIYADKLPAMTEDGESTLSPASEPEDSKQTLAAMRGGWGGWQRWTEEDQLKIDSRECTDASCMNVEVNVGFQGIDEGSHLSQSAGVGNDLRNAWKSKLEEEGKSAGATSLRDVVFGSDSKD
jgi:hypothetical protein